MTILDVQLPRRMANYAVPKPIVVLGLASFSWLLVYGLCVGCFDTLRLLGL